MLIKLVWIGSHCTMDHHYGKEEVRVGRPFSTSERIAVVRQSASPNSRDATGGSFSKFRMEIENLKHRGYDGICSGSARREIGGELPVPRSSQLMVRDGVSKKHPTGNCTQQTNAGQGNAREYKYPIKGFRSD